MNGHWSEPAFAEIAQLVSRRTGLVFSPNRCESFELGVRFVMRESTIADPIEFTRRLDEGTTLFHALLAQVTVGESYFFRDPAHFRFLTDQLLPELDQRWGPTHAPRLWSAGCAAGEEAYSLAIALQELGRLSEATVLGTDLNRAALERARRARYSQWALRGVDAPILDRYFERIAAEAVLRPELRKAVTFQELNLASAGYPSWANGTVSMDLILCRNVLIYLDAEVIRAVTGRLFDCLAPGGYLITGPSDPRLSHPDFEICSIEAGTAYRRRLQKLELDVPRASEEPSVRAAAPPAQQASPLAASLEERANLARVRGDHRALQQLSDAHPEFSWLAIEALREGMKVRNAALVEAECRQAIERHPLAVELHYLHALLLVEVAQPAAAAQSLRKALYLDPSLAIAHFLLGSVLAELRDGVGARRAYRNAERCASGYSADESIPFADEISGPGLARAAARELALLGGKGTA